MLSDSRLHPRKLLAHVLQVILIQNSPEAPQRIFHLRLTECSDYGIFLGRPLLWQFFHL